MKKGIIVLFIGVGIALSSCASVHNYLDTRRDAIQRNNHETIRSYLLTTKSRNEVLMLISPILKKGDASAFVRENLGSPDEVEGHGPNYFRYIYGNIKDAPLIVEFNPSGIVIDVRFWSTLRDIER